MIDWKELQKADEIPGWIFPAEMIVLSYLAAETPIVGRILEIGSWCGRSTRALMGGASAKTPRQIHCVDNWQGGDGADRMGITPEIAKRIFNCTLADQIAAGRIKVFEGDYRDVLPGLEPESYDLIFVDGPHGEEHAEDTVRLVLPLLRETGTIVFHDGGGGWPGVTKMVNLAYETGRFKQGTLIRTMVIFEPKLEKVVCR